MKNTVIFTPAPTRGGADYLAGLLNSTPLNYLAVFSSVRGGKSFGSGGFLARVRIHAYDADNSVHAQISARASEAAAATAAGDAAALAAARAALDRAAATYWGITSDELAEMERLLAGLGNAVAATATADPDAEETEDMDEDSAEDPAPSA